MEILRTILLRHDVDNNLGLRLGIPKILAIEKKHDVRSVFFVRYDEISSASDVKLLQNIVRDGWEVGLHLVNTDGRNGTYYRNGERSFIRPEDELQSLRRRLDVPIYGVTPCGSTIGWSGETTWRILDALNLEYIEGYGKPIDNLNSFVFQGHLTMKDYIIKYGEKRGFHRFLTAIDLSLTESSLTSVLSHPIWFVKPVGPRRTFTEKLGKWINHALGLKLLCGAYDRFLEYYRGKVKFLNYHKYIQNYSHG